MFVFALVCAAAIRASAQDPVRPWRDWRTLETRHYRFHYPRELEAWTRDVAARVEAVDSAIVAVVSYRPPRPIDVVVDDPYAIANGYALPFIDRPVSVWWASPPDPRNDVGDYRSWGEMLAVHELTHIAHLARPSRNPWQRQLWASLPANLGPIARKSPRWVYEGYATLVEGRITGTGRPNNVWRPALLRQWAIEGHLPTYGQLSGWGDFSGGSFAYLSGSAFLEWLTQRQGDSSLVNVWRRMTARTVRTFDAAFAGVYGDAPAVLYGRHAAELTRDAMAAKAALERAGLVEGEMVQHLSWGIGDPALSPNGERVVIVLGDRERPARVVVWGSAPELDTAGLRRRLEQIRRDPEDVPDRRAYPTRKRAVKTLLALNNSEFGQPRWFGDSRRVLLTRWVRRGDGSIRPALYVWDTENGDVRRVSRDETLMHGDPHPDGTEAIAMRCELGRCDIVLVDLRRGAVRPLLAGDARTSYYRPRFDSTGARFVASVAREGRWRIVIANRDGSGVREIDPGDGANRYDAEWVRGDTLVAVSERGGIPNLELIDIATSRARTLTRVTGAALAPDVNPGDGSLWFLTMHSRGFDVRRLPRRAAPADSAITIEANQFGFAALRPPVQRDIQPSPTGEPRVYGNGPRHQRWVPGAQYSGDGGAGFLSIFTGDIVGRLNAVVAAEYGERGTMQGGSLRAAWRYPRPALEVGGYGFLHEPSLGRHAQPDARLLDVTLLQGVLAAAAADQGDGWRVRARLGGGIGTLQRDDASFSEPSTMRAGGFGEMSIQLIQASGSVGVSERLQLHGSGGHTGSRYDRWLASLRIQSVGRDVFPLEGTATIGQMNGTPDPFELFTIGGARSTIPDSSLMSQRYAMPMFPTAIATGNRLFAWRLAMPSRPWTLFMEGASAATDVYSFTKQNRVAGFDARYVLPIVPAAFAPRIEARGGAALTLDEPARHKLRVFFEMHIEP